MTAAIVVEDQVQSFVLRKIFKESLGILPYPEFIMNGKTEVQKKLRHYNAMAKHIPCFVLVDLDADACAPGIKKSWVDFKANPNLVFNVAIREVEAWLIADRSSFANYFQIPKSIIERTPENLLDPKGELVCLMRRSKNKVIRKDIIPFGTARIGERYNARLGDFIENAWRPSQAKTNSTSLSRFINKIKILKA